MDESKLTEEVIYLKGKVCAIEESNTNIKEDINSIKKDVKKLEESDTSINIAIAKMDASIDNLGDRLTSSIDNMKAENSSNNKETRLIFQNTMDDMARQVRSIIQQFETERQASNEKLQTLFDIEKEKQNEIKENRKGWKNFILSNLKALSTGLIGGLVALLFWWIKSK